LSQPIHVIPLSEAEVAAPHKAADILSGIASLMKALGTETNANELAQVVYNVATRSRYPSYVKAEAGAQ
jgi:hypothetical protein